MQLHELKLIKQSKKKKRIGRGGKRGTYSGRGIKGQKARAGRKFKPVIRDLIKRYPKLRGYKQKLRSKGNRASEITILNLDVLEKNFASGEKINPNLLLERKLISKVKGKMPKVKILGKGEVTKKFFIENCAFSKSAKEKIEKAGGKLVIINS